MRAPVRFGKYLLIERIATGGMAEVYKAKSYGVMGFEKLLVIKKILPRLSRNPDFVSLFIHEAKVSVSLNHANIVQVYDLGVVGGDYYIAMEYVHGADLMHTMRRAATGGEPMPTSLACFVVAEIARGLDYAHTLRDPTGRPLQVVHRDVSPHNVLLSYQGDVKLFDFGIARVGRGAGQDHVAGGKQAYMSPEHLGAGPIDARSDIYSAGIVLFELTTGTRLYAGLDAEAKRRAILEQDPPLPSSRNPSIDPRLDEIVASALARDPADRFPSAATLHDALLGFLVGAAPHVNRRELGSYLRRLFAAELEQDAHAGAVINNLDPSQDGLAAAVGSGRPLAGHAEPRPPSHASAPAPAGSLGTGPTDGMLEESISALSNLSVGDQLTLDDLGDESVDTGQFSVSEVTFDGMGLDGGAIAAVGGGARRERWADGERREVYILAADVVGMARLAERLDEEDLIRHNYRLLKDLVRVVRRYRGALDRFYNDRFLVFWGLGRTGAHDQELCLDCAEALARFSHTSPLAGRSGIHLCIGVHRGTLATGVKTRRLRRFVPLGDTLKLATRLCEVAQPGEVLVSDRVAAHALEQRHFDPLDPLSIKGREDRVAVHRLRPERDAVAVEAPSGVWIPRADELERLDQVLERTAAGKPAVLVVQAEAGAGKTRFLQEIGARARGRGFAFHLGSGRFHGDEEPLLPVTDIVRQVAGLPADADERTVRERIESMGEGYGLDSVQIELIGSLFGLELVDPALSYLAGDQRVVDLFDALVQLLEAAASRTTTVVALRNLQSADKLTREFVRHVHRRVLGKPLLLVVTADPDDPLPVDALDDRVASIRLPGWGRPEILAYAREFAGVPEVPGSLVGFIDEASGGNALFVKELLRSLMREGMVVAEHGALVVCGRLASADVPDSVQDLIKSRLDDLDRRGRRAIELASVVGRTFAVDVVADVAGVDAETMAQTLDALVDTDLIRPRSGRGAGATHSFRNTLTWEVSYRGILAARRRELHARVGVAVERLRGEALRPHYEVLYRHFREGGQLARAADYAERAGDIHAGQNYLTDAERCYQQAIGLLRASSAPEEQVGLRLGRIYARLADLSLNAGDVGEARRHANMALEHAADAEAVVEEARALLVLVQAEHGHAHPLVLSAYLDRVEELLDRVLDDGVRLELQGGLARALIAEGELARTAALVAGLLDAPRTSSHRLLLAHLLFEFGELQLRRQLPDEARQSLQTSLDLARGMGDKALLGGVHASLGTARLRLGNADEALASFRRAYRAVKSVELTARMADVLIRIGDALLRDGDRDRALRYVGRARKLATEAEWAEGLARAEVRLAYLRALRGDVDRGRVWLEEAVERARRDGPASALAVGALLLSRMAAARGEDEEAAALRSEALDVAGAADDPAMLDDLARG